MRVVHVNRSDALGGAARAAYRIHQAVQDDEVSSTMQVCLSVNDDVAVNGPDSRFEQFADETRKRLGSLLPKFLRTTNRNLHSPAFMPTYRHHRLNASNADVVHLHWVNEEMLSIRDIGRITKPVVWTLHDMWAFCGAEHYTNDDRWRVGYQRDNRPYDESGWDINRWTWRRKQRHWRRPLHIVAPSRWMASCVASSMLMSDWPVTVIPNPIDTLLWAPLEQSQARRDLGLPEGVPLLLFGTGDDIYDPRKGMHFLLPALGYLREHLPGVELVVLGASGEQRPWPQGIKTHYLGRLRSDAGLRRAYAAADVLVMPSLQDNLPNMAVEAQACGLVTVAFDIGGLADIVAHGRTGYLAKAEDAGDLARGIAELLLHGDLPSLRHACRQHAESVFSYPVVGAQYRALYDQVCGLTQ